MNVIGLSGKLGTGKDHIAREYLYPLGYRQFSLAWHFKIWVIGQGKATYDEVFRTKPAEIRNLLQITGTELGRNVYGENIWVDTMFAWFKTFEEYWGEQNFVIPDVRFPNELNAIQHHGGRVFRIVAPERNLAAPATDEARIHLSETALDTISLDTYDGVIYNDVSDQPIQTQLELLGVI